MDSGDPFRLLDVLSFHKVPFVVKAADRPQDRADLENLPEVSP